MGTSSCRSLHPLGGYVGEISGARLTFKDLKRASPLASDGHKSWQRMRLTLRYPKRDSIAAIEEFLWERNACSPSLAKLEAALSRVWGEGIAEGHLLRTHHSHRTPREGLDSDRGFFRAFL